MPEAGESLDCMVLEFSKEEKKIILSHTKVWQGGTVEEKAPKKSSSKATESAPSKDTSKEGDKSTFGDLDVLSALREQMEDTEKKEKKSAKEADKATSTPVKEENAEKEKKEAE